MRTQNFLVLSQEKVFLYVRIYKIISKPVAGLPPGGGRLTDPAPASVVDAVTGVVGCCLLLVPAIGSMSSTL